MASASEPGRQVETYRLPVASHESVVLDWYAASGSARAALYVHGLGSNRRGQKALHFAQGFNSCGWGFAAFDFRGHGASDGTTVGLTMTGMLADLQTVVVWLRRRGIEKPLLIGASLGAAVIAWHLVGETAPPASVMIAPSLRFPASLTEELAPEAICTWRRQGVRTLKNQWIHLDLGYELVREGQLYDPVRLLREHHSPTLVFHGTNDEIVPWTQSATFAAQANLAQVDLVLIHGGDHRLTAQREFLFDVTRAWLHKLGQLI